MQSTLFLFLESCIFDSLDDVSWQTGDVLNFVTYKAVGRLGLSRRTNIQTPV